MNVYLNHPEYSIIIPAEIFISIGKPSHVQFQLNSDKHIIAIVPANADTTDSFDVPTSVYKGDLFALPNVPFFTDLFRKELGWDQGLRQADAFFFNNLADTPLVLVDTERAISVSNVHGKITLPDYFDDDEGIDDEDEEEIEED